MFTISGSNYNNTILEIMSENLTTIIIPLITLLFSGGAWKFYEMLVKRKAEKQKANKSEQTIFRDDLMGRVDKLENDKEECMSSLLNISTELASLKTKVEYLEKENERLKYK